jgi:RsiW-degrading membrane proteinase PrsW (M82 family)
MAIASLGSLALAAPRAPPTEPLALRWALTVVLTLASTVCACVPMFLFLAIVWWLDRYDREPVWLLALTFLWGAIGGVFGALVGSLVLDVGARLVVLPVASMFGSDADALHAVLGTVAIAPFVEEPSKALFLLYVMWNRHFDNMTDGFVYGAATGLGFGMTENLVYFLSVTGDAALWGSTVVIRTFYSAVMHATASAIVGAALGFARFRGCLALVVCGSLGLALAVAVHGLWNGLLMLGQFQGTSAPFVADLLLFPLEVAGVLLVSQICLADESCTIRRELGAEAARGTLPAEHPPILASAVRRLFRDWIPRGVDHRRYVTAATSLAMRRQQVRQMGKSAPPFYHHEVVRLRREVVALLARGVVR